MSIKTEFQISLLIGFTLLSILSIAQGDYRPGFIINNNQDSIKGFVGYRSERKNSERCDFKETKKSKASKYLPADIKSYGISGDKEYKSISLSIDTLKQISVFVKILAKGPLSLYRYKKLFLLEKETSPGLITLPIPKNKVVETKNGTMIQNDHRYIDILNTFLEDAQLSANRSHYNEGDLTNLINNYNKFKGKEPANKSPLPSTKLTYEVLVGYVHSNMKMDIKNNETSFSPSSTVTAGLGLDVSSPRISDKISLSVHVWYTKAFYQAYVSSPYTVGDIVHEDILIDLSMFKVPIGLRYNFLGESNTPYIKFGFAPYFIKSSKLRTLSDIEIDDVVKAEETYGNYNIKNSQGLWLSVGYVKTIASNFKIFAELRGEKNNGFIGSTIQSRSSSINYNILLGIRF